MKDLRIQKLVKIVDPGRKVLNVGCAQNPEIHAALAKKSSKIIGVDLNKEGIKSLKDAGFDAHFMNAEDIVLDETFDFILAGEVIEHLNNPGLFLESATKHLKKNGKLIITTPNISSLFLIPLVLVFDKSQDPGHVNYFDLKNLRVLVSRYGLLIDSYFFVPPSIKTLGGNPLFRLIFFFATVLANLGFIFSPRLFGSYIFLVLTKKE